MLNNRPELAPSTILARAEHRDLGPRFDDVGLGCPLGCLLCGIVPDYNKFWLLDLLFGLRTGVYKQETLVLETSVVARTYLQMWFVPDVVVLLSD